MFDVSTYVFIQEINVCKQVLYFPSFFRWFVQLFVHICIHSLNVILIYAYKLIQCLSLSKHEFVYNIYVLIYRHTIYVLVCIV